MRRTVLCVLGSVVIALTFIAIVQAEESKPRPLEEVLPAVSEKLAEKVKEASALSTSAKRELTLRQFAEELSKELAEDEVEVKIPIRDVRVLGPFRELRLADIRDAEKVPGIEGSVRSVRLRLSDEEVFALDPGHLCVLTGRLVVAYPSSDMLGGRKLDLVWLKHGERTFILVLSDYRVTFDTSKRVEVSPEN